MWTMGYNDGEEFNNNMQDSFNATGDDGRLHPLMTRPATSTNHGGDLFPLNHHLALMAEQNKRGVNTQQVVVSSRWNPTPEQLHALEELYQKGTRTPSAEQIQQITVELRRYGKIEGKNVFYWFQNHKARERQKRRRQLESPKEEINPNNNNTNHSGEKKESLMAATGANYRTVHEAEQTKYNWGSPTNSSTIAPEKTVTSTTQGAGGGTECKADGWVYFNDHDAEELLLQQQGKNATWQMMQNLSSSSTNLITINPPPTIPTMDHDLIINPILINPTQQNFENIFLERPYNPGNDDVAQTLQLFPLISGGVRGQSLNNMEYWDHETGGLEENSSSAGSPMNSTNGNSNYQFFEFLPLKN